MKVHHLGWFTWIDNAKRLSLSQASRLWNSKNQYFKEHLQSTSNIGLYPFKYGDSTLPATIGFIV